MILRHQVSAGQEGAFEAALTAVTSRQAREVRGWCGANFIRPDPDQHRREYVVSVHTVHLDVSV